MLYKLLSEPRLESEGKCLQTHIWGYVVFCREIRMKLRSKDIKAGASILRMEFAMADSQETARKGPQAFASDWPNILERK